MQFGEKLRKIRQERNLTQPDLADQLGIEQSWLSKLENDKSVPSSELLDKVCQVFGLSLEQLLADLDSHYLRNQLDSLPEVRGLMQEKRYTLVHNARRWLLTATVLVAFGVTFFLSGNEQWLFKEILFRYESQGIVFEGEPEHLFDDPQDSLMPIVFTDIENAQKSDELNNQYYRTNISRLHEIFYEKKRAILQQRNDGDTQIKQQDLGDYFRVETTVLADATNIFGDPIATGSPAHRIYSMRGTSPNSRWQNSWLRMLGVLLATSGLLLYFVEWRMAKSTKANGG